MPAVTISPVAQGQLFDDLGQPLAGGRIFTYAGGSFSVLQTTYSNYLGTIANSNPIVLDSDGRLPVTLWLVQGLRYNIVITRADGTTVLQTFENIKGVEGVATGVDQIIAGTNVTISPTGGTGAVTINAAGGGGGGTPASPTNAVQYNASGSFGGTSKFLFDPATDILTLGPTNTASIVEGEVGQTLTIISDGNLGLQSTTGNAVVTLGASATPKVTVSGPTAVQYATGLADSNLANKYYVDTTSTAAAAAVLPSQTGQTGKFLKTDGSAVSWDTIGTGVTGPVSSTTRAVATWNGTSGSALYDNANVGVTSDGKLQVGDIYFYNGAWTSQLRANIAIGINALAINTTGSANIAIGCGDGPLAANTTGEYNVAIGSSALNDNLIGSYNVAVGTNALYANADVGGQFNTAIGHEAGVNLYSGSGNTIIGAIQGPSSMNDTVLIAAGLNKQRLRINENGAWSFTNPYNAESLDYGTLGFALVSNGTGAHPDWKPANTKLPSYTETGNPVAFDPVVAGKVIKKAAGTIAANDGVCSADDFFMVYNTSSSSMTIQQGSGFTLRQAGTANTGNRTLAGYGFARVWFVSASEAVVSGEGLS